VARLFEPIILDLIKAAKVERASREPLVVVGHSLGGVLLYDILTDRDCLDRLEREAPGFKIDAWLTVGSQPGFFADLGLYPDKPKNAAGQLSKPACVNNCLNVYDFTDVFSFLCKPFFEGVDDFGYDTAVDLIHAHSAYFKRPSFYKRLELRLHGLSYL
jgi:alpha-beta hydrolase superfamily lysophospholipase